MNIYKLFTIASIAFLSCFLIRADLQEPLQNGQYGNFKEYDGQDKPYLFNVPEDGQMMRSYLILRQISVQITKKSRPSMSPMCCTII